MSFLQPWLLVALPLAALPVVIHLINQRRFQSIQWAAMRFLLEANRMSRGYARLRQWLILLARVLAIAALIFVISRPLATGWLGLSGGGRPDTTIVLLDRSASMSQQGVGTVESKLETGVAQLAQTLTALGSSRWILIDSVALQPIELKSPAGLLQSPNTRPATAAADVAALLQASYDYIKNNRAGQTEIWICSDLRANDWNAESGRWKGLRDSFQQFKQSVRFHLLAYPTPVPGNLSVRAMHVERRAKSDGTAALYISLRLVRTCGETGKRSVPLRFDIDGVRSELEVEMDGPELELKNHRIPLARDRVRGWGRISVPADECPADDEFYFVFDAPPPHHTLLVTEDPTESRPLELAAGSSPDPATKSEVEVRGPNQLAVVPWEQVALVLWQAPLPEGDIAEPVRQFVARGGQIIYFPPRSPHDEAVDGVRWTAWQSPPEPIRVETWRGDQDLLAHTQSGAALPVGELTVRRYCTLEGDLTPLAKFYGGAPLLARVTAEHGGIYFCAATASPADASLGIDGVTLYVAIQRALAAGAAELVQARQLAAGADFPPATADGWQRVAGSTEVLSTEYPFQAGVYSADQQMLAVNRAEAEDRPTLLSDARVAGLFRGLDFDRVDDQAGNVQSLAREIWRVCLATMVVALIAEAGLCLPKPPRPTGGTP